MSLDEKLYNVTSLDSFPEFVDALINDNHANLSTWQNHSIESYLEAAAARARDSRGLNRGMSEDASWQTFADFLYGGKIYE